MRYYIDYTWKNNLILKLDWQEFQEFNMEYGVRGFFECFNLSRKSLLILQKTVKEVERKMAKGSRRSRNQRSNSKNPNNKAHKDSRDNRANQKNPNNDS